MKPCNSVTQCTKEEIITMLEDQLVPNATEAEAKIFFPQKQGRLMSSTSVRLSAPFLLG